MSGETSGLLLAKGIMGMSFNGVKPIFHLGKILRMKRQVKK
jgi:hypothetical protein